LDVEWIAVFEIKKEIPDNDVPTFDSPRNGIQDAAIFEGLSPDDLKLVLSRASLRAARKGALLFRQGEPAREMFLLESGCVRLNENTADGRELLVRFVRPGEVFGDKAAIAGADYGASAVSKTPVRTYAWTTGMIVALLKEVPRLATNLFVITTRYLHYSRERYRLLATVSAERRIRWALADLARSIGSPEGNATVITGRSIQRDVADLAATTIYTVNRVLSGYERRGILTRRRGRIVLFRKFQ
jgi:CRP/FNR family transcriptional regulator, nitrogen oxide reductase regulator